MTVIIQYSPLTIDHRPLTVDYSHFSFPLLGGRPANPTSALTISPDLKIDFYRSTP